MEFKNDSVKELAARRTSELEYATVRTLAMEYNRLLMQNDAAGTPTEAPKRMRMASH